MEGPPLADPRASSCFECGEAVDALRAPARVVGAQVVAVCERCADRSGEASAPATERGAARRTLGPARLPAHAVRPAADRGQARRALGPVRLSSSALHPASSRGQARRSLGPARLPASAFQVGAARSNDAPGERGEERRRPARVTAAPEPELGFPAGPGEAARARRRRRPPRRVLLAVAMVAVPASAALAFSSFSESSSSSDDAMSQELSAASMAPAPRRRGQARRAPGPRVLEVESGELREVPTPPVPEEVVPMEESARSEEEWRPPEIPGAVAWVHPLAESEERVPVKVTRRYGASRPGDRPKECGAGHCGLDLSAPRGTPVVSISAGIVERVVRARDHGSGKYVRVRHEAGVRSSYMHLDDILPGIEPGVRVAEGEMLGSLGRTGIQNSEPHLHFAVSVKGRYVDPEAALEEALVISVLDLHVNDRVSEPESAWAFLEPASRREAEPVRDVEAEVEAEPEPEPDFESDSEPEAEPEAEVEAEAEADLELEAELDP